MQFNIDIEDNDVVDISQADIEAMWNIVSDDTENFIYGACVRLEGLDLDYWAPDNQDLRKLYETLKQYYE